MYKASIHRRKLRAYSTDMTELLFCWLAALLGLGSLLRFFGGACFQSNVIVNVCHSKTIHSVSTVLSGRAGILDLFDIYRYFVCFFSAFHDCCLAYLFDYSTRSKRKAFLLLLNPIRNETRLYNIHETKEANCGVD